MSARAEEWLEMAGTDRYLISTRGQILDVPRNRLVGARLTLPNNRLRATVKLRGQRGRGSQVSVATAVLDTFDPVPVAVTGARVAAFRDGDVRHCWLDNLYWVARTDAAGMAEARALIAAFESRGTAEPEEPPPGTAVQFVPAESAAVAVPNPAADAGGEPVRTAAHGARPGGLVTPEALDAARAGRRAHADLSPDEKSEVRAWWVARGGSSRGRIPTDAIAAWDASKPALTGAS